MLIYSLISIIIFSIAIFLNSKNNLKKEERYHHSTLFVTACLIFIFLGNYRLFKFIKGNNELAVFEFINSLIEDNTFTHLKSLLYSSLLIIIYIPLKSLTLLAAKKWIKKPIFNHYTLKVQDNSYYLNGRFFIVRSFLFYLRFVFIAIILFSILFPKFLGNPLSIYLSCFLCFELFYYFNGQLKTYPLQNTDTVIEDPIKNSERFDKYFNSLNDTKRKGKIIRTTKKRKL